MKNALAHQLRFVEIFKLLLCNEFLSNDPRDYIK